MPNNFYLNISTADTLGIGLFKYSLSPQEKFIITNSTLPKMLGYSSRKELKEKRLSDLFFDVAAKDEFFRMLREDGGANFFEALFKDKWGKGIWVAITVSCITAYRRTYLEGIIENISAHKDMEEKLSLERKLLQGLLDNIPDAVYFKDYRNRIIKVNKFYAQGMGLKNEEITGKTDFDFFPHHQAQKMAEDDNCVLRTGKSIIGKIERTLLPNGTWNHVITTKIPMYDSDGRIIGTMGITRDITAYANAERGRLDMVINALKVLGKALEMRDPYTFTHTQGVAAIAQKIGRSLGLDDDKLLELRLAGELHDLGKITIPLDILNKPGSLSKLEYQLIKEHVDKCYNLIKEIEFPFPLAETIHQHHERLDGSGYPKQLKDSEILFEARILAISDVLEAMTHHRPYREALGLKTAREELKNGAGTKYDSGIVDVALGLIKEEKVFWDIV